MVHMHHFVELMMELGSFLLTIMGRPIPLLIGVTFTDEFSILGAAEIALALKVLDVRAGIDPDQFVPRACHARWWCMIRRLGRCGRAGQAECTQHSCRGQPMSNFHGATFLLRTTNDRIGLIDIQGYESACQRRLSPRALRYFESLPDRSKVLI